MKKILKAIKAHLGIALLILGLVIFDVSAIAYYTSIFVPSEKDIIYSATAYIDGIQWVNDTKLNWNNSTKELDVLNTGTVPAYVYVNTQGLPTNWNLTWAEQAIQIQPNEWANGTLTLLWTPEPGNYTWDMWIQLGA
jgi:hypothetical protein